MKANPIILDSAEHDGQKLQRIQSTTKDAKDEKWLQELLYRHPDLLPVEHFDESFGPPIPIGREVRTSRGPIDNLYISPDGGITIVETKLWRNPEKHRTVVAQIIDYAKEVATWNYDTLNDAVRASSRSRGEAERASLEDKVASHLATSDIEYHEFQESVATTLLEGTFLLLIVGDKVSPNIALLTQAIQSAPGLGFTLGLVEMQMFPTKERSDWPLLVVPEIVGRTVEKTRGVVRVRYSNEKPDVSVEIESEEDPPSTTGRGPIDYEEFLRTVPKDLVQPFKGCVDEWKKSGNKMVFTQRMMFFAAELAGKVHRVVRCRNNQTSVVRRFQVEEWGGDPILYDSYLDDLDGAPVFADHARNDGFWVGHAKVSADDLRVLVRAAMNLVQTIQEAEEG